MFGQQPAESSGGFGRKVDILALPPGAVDVVFVILDELPLVTDGDLKVACITSWAQGLRYFFITPALRPGALPLGSSSPAGSQPFGTGQVVTQISSAPVFFSSSITASRLD
jgi:hypothetical protein